MRLIDANELIKGRVENDPVRIAAECAPTAFDKENVIEEIKAKYGRLTYWEVIQGICEIVEKGGVD